MNEFQKQPTRRAGTRSPGIPYLRLACGPPRYHLWTYGWSCPIYPQATIPLDRWGRGAWAQGPYLLSKHQPARFAQIRLSVVSRNLVVVQFSNSLIIDRNVSGWDFG